MARAQGARVPAQLQKRGRPRPEVGLGRPRGRPRARAAEPSAVAVDAETLARWRRSPFSFIREALRHPDTLEPIQLYPKQQAWLTAGFTPDLNGKLPCPEVLMLAPKKSGKSFCNALAILYTVVVLGGRRAEGYVLANDLHQAASRVFQACCELVAASPVLRDHVAMTSTRIDFPATGSFIEALAADAAGAAGANPTCISFDEIWGIEHARAKRLFAEMVPVPTRPVSVRVSTSYPGFLGQSPVLEELHRRGLRGDEVSPGIFRSKRMVMAWFKEAVSPLQDAEWYEQMREQLGEAEYRRMVLCEFVSSSSLFLSSEEWDAVEDRNLRPILAAKPMPVWVGVDASVKHDSTAIAVCTYDTAMQKVRL
ncbi:MAG TPA: hypothetical protein VKU61_13410, partial [Candidatus Binatia bacterium]|nr:hypothetical protein [Candidatus Binatia bacterium]